VFNYFKQAYRKLVYLRVKLNIATSRDSLRDFLPANRKSKTEPIKPLTYNIRGKIKA